MDSYAVGKLVINFLSWTWVERYIKPIDLELTGILT